MINISKKDRALLLETGYLYLAMGKFMEARKVFEGLCILMPKHEVPVVALSNVLFAEFKFLPAIRTLKQAISINPKSAFAHAHLGESYLFYGKKEEAIKELNLAIELDRKKDQISEGKAADFAKSIIALIDKGFEVNPNP